MLAPGSPGLDLNAINPFLVKCRVIT